MPELPEVETVRLGLLPHLKNRYIRSVLIRQRKLRWPIPSRLPSILAGQKIKDVTRRGKYLLIECSKGTLIFHLGMSGRLRIYLGRTPHEKHDHFEMHLDSGDCVRLHDPRRFGAVLWTTKNPLSHPLLIAIGPEPLTEDFYATKLYQCLHKRSASIKHLIMDGKIVAGVGNIYANEALFRAGIRPQTAGQRVSLIRCESLVTSIREVLTQALAAGGSSLRDFVDSNGEPGYFQQQYFVYGRTNKPCLLCQTPIKTLRQGQRASFYCPKCQKS